MVSRKVYSIFQIGKTLTRSFLYINRWFGTQFIKSQNNTFVIKTTTRNINYLLI